MIPKKWDREADVVVVGFGGAGVAAAVTACELGAEVIILEKAPEGEEGGNTRVAAQGYLNTSSAEKAATYLKALCGPYPVSDEMIGAWSEEMCLNNDWLSSLGADPQEHQHQPVGIEFQSCRAQTVCINIMTVQPTDFPAPGTVSRVLSKSAR